MKKCINVIILFAVSIIFAQPTLNVDAQKFAQLGQELPTPNAYRTASGAPGYQYWQQKANYKIEVFLDDDTQRLTGDETITYFNNSPDVLKYLWIQLDQNMRAQGSNAFKIRTGTLSGEEQFDTILRYNSDYDGGFKIEYVKDNTGKLLPYSINGTMMRVDLPKPLKHGDSYRFQVKWWYNINDREKVGGRSGMEFFKEDSNYIYTIAQFYPRMAVYNDYEGWQNKQFLGRGEFTLEFGDFDVKITVPSDHIVAATGVLQNTKQTLSTIQRSRLNKARTSTEPILVVTPNEAVANESERSNKTKTWYFKAENVRDFAFASSRKFIWDAMAVKFGNRTVMAMSYYPKEGNPLWGQYSTKVVAHTLKNYSKYTVDYPYPHASSIHTNNIGMEYPMMAFNGGRPKDDETYSKGTKYGMIGVVRHEVGHNYFPMIINSDERQWTWLDEGLNTFVQNLTAQAWKEASPSHRGNVQAIADYMSGDKAGQVPIMTNSESLKQFGNNAYGKVAAALNILRETVLGRELFDYAFKEYAQRWMFKHPTPYDFFRTIEDASGIDLDWFWRGWFFTTDYVDISIDDVKWYQVDTGDPNIEKPLQKERFDTRDKYIAVMRNKAELKRTVEQDTSLLDFYDTYDRFEITAKDSEKYAKYLDSLDADEIALLTDNNNYYELSFSNLGGLVMPIILEFEFDDAIKEIQYIPAEIWLKNTENVSKVFVFDKIVKRIVLDPYLETADADRSNNYWPPRIEPTRMKLNKRKESKIKNPMQLQKEAEELKQKEDIGDSESSES
ncbi:MAG: M1 family peptidase [Planctomycetia bacterium]|nr:M1 family peptidase [Planctomycetia bacterium]